MSSYGRQTQSKAQNESNARILRALVKQPDNKVCADCKKNDPRWASWNIGCFLCIRCSGIHRSMGTHISKVKSIDLDIWTPEQMAAIQQWGNKRCNLYWEAHLKAGHVPPEHKVESFIRSKYEVKRWAKEGPVPSDPSSLDEGGSSVGSSSATTAPASASATGTPQKTKAAAPSAIDLLGGDVGPGVATTSLSKPRNSSSLLDDPPAAVASSNPVSTSAAKTEKSASGGGGGGGGLFDLDWHAAPTSPTDSAAPTSKGNKKDILSLYSSTSPRQAAPSAPLDAFGGLNLGGQPQNVNSGAATNPWGMPATQQQSVPAPNASRGANMFSTQDVWGSPVTATTATTTTTAPSMSNDLWGDMTSGTTSSTSKPNQTTQNDAFADIWK